MCSHQLDASGEENLNRDYWTEREEKMAERGERLLGTAFKKAKGRKQQLTFEDIESGMVFLGLFGITDPPREEAVAAVKACTSAVIRVKMITGDHGRTARAIGLQMGIGWEHPAVTDVDLEKDDDSQLREWATERDVFARASPEHKLRLVQALQARGEIVAMT
jgi:magnesium-transporting ATPase (P-type)